MTLLFNRVSFHRRVENRQVILAVLLHPACSHFSGMAPPLQDQFNFMRSRGMETNAKESQHLMVMYHRYLHLIRPSRPLIPKRSFAYFFTYGLDILEELLSVSYRIVQALERSSLQNYLAGTKALVVSRKRRSRPNKTQQQAPSSSSCVRSLLSQEFFENLNCAMYVLRTRQQSFPMAVSVSAPVDTFGPEALLLPVDEPGYAPRPTLS